MDSEDLVAFDFLETAIAAGSGFFGGVGGSLEGNGGEGIRGGRIDLC